MTSMSWSARASSDSPSPGASLDGKLARTVTQRRTPLTRGRRSSLPTSVTRIKPVEPSTGPASSTTARVPLLQMAGPPPPRSREQDLFSVAGNSPQSPRPGAVADRTMDERWLDGRTTPCVARREVEVT